MTEVLVVGAGSTGANAALQLARAGRQVTLIDQRPRGKTGARWINGVPPWCFDEAGVARPVSPERWGGDHDAASVVTIRGGGPAVRIERSPTVHVDMRALVNRLVKHAEEAGVTTLFGAKLVDLGMSKGRIVEAHVESRGARTQLRPQLVVDASGMRGAVRGAVPTLARECADPGREHVCSAAQHTYGVSDADGLRRFLASYGAEPGEGLSFIGAAGGYSTLTLFTEPTLTEVGVLTGTVPSMGNPSGPELLERFIDSVSWTGEHRFGGAGAIPIRRPYARLHAGGAVLLGDAACMVYPSHGSGVGMGMIAARHLADAVGTTGDPGDASKLDHFETEWHRAYGGLLSGSDAFRRFAQGLDESAIRGLMNAGLFDAHLFGAGLDQRPPPVTPEWLLAMSRRIVREPRRALRVLPAVGRTLLLQELVTRVPPRGPTRHTWDRIIEIIAGPTPTRDRANDR